MIRTLSVLFVLALSLVLTSTSHASGRVYTTSIVDPSNVLVPNGDFYDEVLGGSTYNTYLPANDKVRQAIERARCKTPAVRRMVVAYVIKRINGKKVKVIKGVVF